MNKAFLRHNGENYSEVYRRIGSLLNSDNRVIVAIDGYCGAGKSTLAKAIGQVYDCNVFHMDHFFLTPELRTKERLMEVGGNVDYVRFRDEVILGLQSGKEFKYRIYDCKKMSMSEQITVLPKQLSIIEGAYSMHPTLIDYYNLKLFLKIDKEEQKRRIQKRNGDVMLNRFLSEWIPKENIYFDKMRIEQICDLVLG